MKTSVFLAAVPRQDSRMLLAQKIDRCEAKRPPLIRLQWTHIQDWHATLGYIANVELSDLRTVAAAMASVAENSVFMSNVGSVKLFGSALVLTLEPYHSFFNIHKKMNSKLQEATQQRYQFESSKRYSPHITLARVKNVSVLQPHHKLQLINLVQEQFAEQSLLIQQVALMRHDPFATGPIYQVLKLYSFKG